MADINRDLEELAEITRQVNREFAMFGQLTKETADQLKDAEMQQKHGIKNFTAATEKGGEAVINLGKAMGQAASSMYQGKKGAAAFNDSVDSLTTAAKAAAAGLMLLGGPLGLLAGAVLAGVAALGEYTKAANEMSDKLYKGYQGLAESGAAASDGMTGLFEDAKKLGISMNDLDGYVQLIGENSKDLALFSGTVFEGRQKFADAVKAMEPFKESLMNAGLTQEQINTGAMQYLRLQTRIGASQNKITTDLGVSAAKYMLEMDALTKITGVNRKEQEEIMESARSEQRFRAKLDAMRASGDEKQIAAADKLERANIILSSQSKETGQAFRDIQSGAITTEAAQKGLISSQGELMRSSEKLRNGQITELELVNNVGRSMGAFNKSMNMTAQLGVLNDFAIDYAQAQKLAIFTQKDLTEQQRLAEEELAKQGGKGGKAADAAVQAQTDLRITQQKANEATERFVFAGIVPATKAMEVLAKTTTAGTESLNKLFGIGKQPTSAAAPRGPELTKATAELDATTERARLAAERASAAEKDANLTRAEKDRIKKEARESEAAVMQDIFKQREAQLREQNARRAARRAGTAAPTSPAPAAAAPGGAAPAAAPSSAAPVSVSPAAPAAPAPAATGGGGGSAAAPAARPAAPVTGYDGKPTQGGAPEGAATAETGVQTGSEVKIGKEIRKGGTVSWRTNNPGNISYAGITKKHGAIGAWKKPDGDEQQRTSGIAIMPSLEAGENVQMDQWRRKSYIDLSIDQAVNRWTGQHSGLGSTYAKDLAKAAGVDLGTAVRELSDDQLRKLVKKQAVWEGFKPGTVVSAADGGMFSGPKSGYSATLHGSEAVIPLKNGAVPVSLSMTDVLGGLSDDISEQLKEIKDQTVSANDTALRQVTSEFKTAMAQLSQQLSENAKMQNQDNMSGIYALMEELVSATKSGVSVQQKILASSY